MAGASCVVAGLIAVALQGLQAPMATARRADSPKVLVATTGNDSETRKTVPITRRAKSEKRVVMSMGPDTLPDLIADDRLKLSAMLQVTVDCYRPDPSCAGHPYRFNPRVGSRLVLAPDARTTGGEHAIALSDRRTIGCRAKLPGRQHHCVVVFPNASLSVNDPGELPCGPGSCHVNLVIDAHNPHAVRGNRLVIGSEKPSGRIVQDKGRINAIRLRPGSQPRPPTLPTTKRRHTRLPLNQNPTVVLSKRLDGLKRNEQLAVIARMRTDVSQLPYSTRVTTHLILAARRNSTKRSHRVAEMASLRGEIAEGNGSNCTTVQTPCPYTMVGVVRMLRTPTDRSGNPIPLYANLYVVSNPKRATRRPGDRLKVLPHPRMKVARYAPSLRG